MEWAELGLYQGVHSTNKEKVKKEWGIIILNLTNGPSPCFQQECKVDLLGRTRHLPHTAQLNCLLGKFSPAFHHLEVEI